MKVCARRGAKAVWAWLWRLTPGLGAPSAQPHRVRMAHELIVNYDMYKYLDVYVRWQRGPAPAGRPPRLTERPPQRPRLVAQEEMTRFHADDYINFLQMITPDNMAEYRRQLQRCARWLQLSLPSSAAHRAHAASDPARARPVRFQSTWETTAPYLTASTSSARSTPAARWVRAPRPAGAAFAAAAPTAAPRFQAVPPS